jgi:hypothetical protein
MKKKKETRIDIFFLINLDFTAVGRIHGSAKMCACFLTDCMLRGKIDD